MSMYLLPKTTTEKLDKHRRTFFWQGGAQKRKYHLVRWGTINKSKKYGGLGLKYIRTMNVSLLCKWWWKIEFEEGLWQDVVRTKYQQGESVGFVKHRDSLVWADLIKIKHIYLEGRVMKTRNGKQTFFWFDKWLLDKPLCFLPVLFDICQSKNIFVRDFLRCQGQLEFSRWLNPVLFAQWLEVVDSVYHYNFENGKDTPMWRWTKNKCFSTKYVYDILTKEESGRGFKHIWKAKIPYKIKNFMWLAKNNAILTKDNLIRRHWVGSPCYFCHEDESVDHLLPNQYGGGGGHWVMFWCE